MKLIHILSAFIFPLLIITQNADAQSALMQALPEKKAAPAIGWKDAKGNDTSIADYKGKTVLLHFWATWCPPCVEELPQMMHVDQSNVTLIPISLDRQPIQAQIFYQKHDINLPFFYAENQKILRAYGVKGLPASLVIDHNGHIIAGRMGAVDWSKQTFDFTKN